VTKVDEGRVILAWVEKEVERHYVRMMRMVDDNPRKPEVIGRYVALVEVMTKVREIVWDNSP